MKWITICLMLFLCRHTIAQNLVPNPSFEDTVACPTLVGQVTMAKNWYDLLYTPDYFHSCAALWQLSTPSNFAGFQYPHSGNAYMGMWLYQSPNTIREVIGAYLTTPLIVGQKYFINFKANCSYNFPIEGNNTACNKLGILFSTINYIFTAPPISNFAQIYTDSIISDTLNWVTIRGSFVSDSAYSFISIGNFFDNAHTDTLHIANSNSFQAYVYVDDFCISVDSLYSEVWTSLHENILNGNINCFPNPATNKLTIDNIPFDCKKMDIYNIDGVRVHSITINNKHTIEIDISTFKSGIYSLVCVRRKTIQTKKIIKL